MQDCAFNLALIPRGLGRLPAPPPEPPPSLSAPPEPPASVQGLGQDPEGLGQEPEGLGKPASFPSGIKMLNPQPHCQRWLLAFVNGARKPNVLLHDGAGFDYQHMLNLLAQHTGGQRSQFFSFTGSEGTYLFAYDIVNGKHVIKMCVDGLTLHHTPHSSVPWTVSVHPAAHPVATTGLGAIYKTLPAYSGSGVMSGGGVQINPINRAVGGTWAPLGTIDSSGNFTATDPTGQLSKAGDLQDTLNNWGTNIQQVGGTSPKIGGYFYFGLSDTNNGAAQTPGEPPGMAIMRFNGTRLDMLIKETGGPGGVPGTPTWMPSVYAYISGGTVHTPPMSPPPGVSSTAGSWVWRPAAIVPGIGVASFWMWYPTANVPTFLPTPASLPPTGAASAMIAPTPAPGTPSGIWVYANAAAATSGTTNPLPPPTSPPVAGAQGQWASKHNGYYVWIGTGAPAAAPATTSSTGLILLGVLGVLAVGGVGYYLLS